MKNQHAFQKLALLFPSVSGGDLADLAADIHEKGLLNPIVRHKGKILDGVARVRACKIAHVTPRFVEFSSLGLHCTPENYLWSANVERRHLTPDQRTVLADKWAKVQRTEAKRRQLQALQTKRPVEGSSSQPNATRRAIAARAGVSAHKVRQLEKVKKFAPALVPNVRAGKMTLKEAEKQADRKRPKSKLLNMPIRNPLTPDRAVSQTMKSLSADVKKLLHRVEDKTNFFEILAEEVSQWCRKMSKAA